MIVIRAETRDSETARSTCPFFLALGKDYSGYLCAQAGWRDPGCCYSVQSFFSAGCSPVSAGR